MLETKRISDAIESVRGRLEESSSCPAKSDRRISKYVSPEAYVTKERKKYSSPRKVAKSPPFSISIATEEGIIIESKSRLESVRIKGRIQSAASLGIKASFLC